MTETQGKAPNLTDVVSIIKLGKENCMQQMGAVLYALQENGYTLQPDFNRFYIMSDEAVEKLTSIRPDAGKVLKAMTNAMFLYIGEKEDHSTLLLFCETIGVIMIAPEEALTKAEFAEHCKKCFKEGLARLIK